MLHYARDLGIGATIDVTNVPQTQKYIVAVLLGIAIWSSIEMLPVIYFTFTRYSGLYFWSMLIANLGVLVYAAGFVLNNFQLTGNQTLPTVLTCAFWIPMVSAQSLVLYSRLHLINTNDTIRRLVLGMIIFNGVTLHTGTAITTIGSNSKSAEMFLLPYAIMERIQVTVFFLQECILSCLYLWKARNFLSLRRSRNAHGKAHQKLRLMMVHLIISNIIVLALDVTILILEFMGLYFLQVSYKAFVYAVKLKCEVGILNRLADFVKSATGSSGAGAWADKNDLLGADGDGARRHFQDFHSFQLSSQMEREWETTLRNTFGVAMADEEKKNVDGNNQGHYSRPLPSPRAALATDRAVPAVKEGRRRASRLSGGSSSGASGGVRASSSGLDLLETFGRDRGGGSLAAPSVAGSLNDDDNEDWPLGGRRSATDELGDEAEVVTVAEYSSSLEMSRGGILRA